jgi:hypothetical protein
MGKREKVLIVGNHADWERQFIEKHPELEGWMERPQALHLEETQLGNHAPGHAKKLGQLNVIHGEILTGFVTRVAHSLVAKPWSGCCVLGQAISRGV